MRPGRLAAVVAMGGGAAVLLDLLIFCRVRAAVVRNIDRFPEYMAVPSRVNTARGGGAVFPSILLPAAATCLPLPGGHRCMP